jgi:hypothetical protein
MRGSFVLYILCLFVMAVARQSRGPGEALRGRIRGAPRFF